MRNNRVARASMLFAILSVVPSAMAQRPQPKSLRLYVIDCGSLNPTDTSPDQLTKEELATTMMSVASFLVVQPKGTMMWDPGALPDSSFKPGGRPAILRYATSTKPS